MVLGFDTEKQKYVVQGKPETLNMQVIESRLVDPQGAPGNVLELQVPGSIQSGAQQNVLPGTSTQATQGKHYPNLLRTTQIEPVYRTPGAIQTTQVSVVSPPSSESSVIQQAMSPKKPYLIIQQGQASAQKEVVLVVSGDNSSSSGEDVLKSVLNDPNIGNILHTQSETQSGLQTSHILHENSCQNEQKVELIGGTGNSSENAIFELSLSDNRRNQNYEVPLLSVGQPQGTPVTTVSLDNRHGTSSTPSTGDMLSSIEGAPIGGAPTSRMDTKGEILMSIPVESSQGDQVLLITAEDTLSEATVELVQE